MPEFNMPLSGSAGYEAFSDLPPFVRGYIEAMFFTEGGTPLGESGDPEDELEGCTFEDLAPEALEAIIRDCDEFQTEASLLLLSAYARDYSAEQAGRDLWFTRNGHGAGFWDREVLAHNELGDLLSVKANDMGVVDPYKGDDGRVYHG